MDMFQQILLINILHFEKVIKMVEIEKVVESPCKKCITFPICKNKFINNLRKNEASNEPVTSIYNYSYISCNSAFTQHTSSSCGTFEKFVNDVFDKSYNNKPFEFDRDAIDNLWKSIMEALNLSFILENT
jgi:hypothetical protein